MAIKSERQTFFFFQVHKFILNFKQNNKKKELLDRGDYSLKLRKSF